MSCRTTPNLGSDEDDDDEHVEEADKHGMI